MKKKYTTVQKFGVTGFFSFSYSERMRSIDQKWK